MFRITALFLLTAPLIQGFGVVPPTTRALAVAHAPAVVLYAEDDKYIDEIDDEEMFGFEDGVDLEYGHYDEDDDVEEEFVPPPVTMKATSTASSSSKEKMAKAAETATTAFKAAASKAQDFANDERVQEIAGKAQDFAKDVFGQIFTKVGDKLKEIKKEKEERAKQEMDN